MQREKSNHTQLKGALGTTKTLTQRDRSLLHAHPLSAGDLCTAPMILTYVATASHALFDMSKGH